MGKPKKTNASRAPLADLVVYHNAHRLRGTEPSAHLSAFQAFVSACATNVESEGLAVVLRSGPEYPNDQTAAYNALLHKRWGAPTLRPVVISEQHGVEEATWQLKAAAVDDLLSLLKQAPKAPKGGLAAVSVEVAVSIELAEPGSRDPLPGQRWDEDAYKKDEWFLPHGYSRVWVSIGDQSWLGLLLSLPFSATDPALPVYVSFLQSHLPMKLSVQSKNWHWWKVNSAGTKHYRKAAVQAIFANAG
jgi:hypothetical protein